MRKVIDKAVRVAGGVLAVAMLLILLVAAMYIPEAGDYGNLLSKILLSLLLSYVVGAVAAKLWIFCEDGVGSRLWAPIVSLASVALLWILTYIHFGPVFADGNAGKDLASVAAEISAWVIFVINPAYDLVVLIANLTQQISDKTAFDRAWKR